MSERMKPNVGAGAVRGVGESVRGDGQGRHRGGAGAGYEGEDNDAT